MQSRHTKQSIIEILTTLASNLETDRLSKKLVSPHIPISSIRYHFGSFGRAVEASGLKTTLDDESRPKKESLSEEYLFKSLCDLENQPGREPSYNDNTAFGKFSQKPFKRFGKWADVLQHYRKWKFENNIEPSQGKDTGNSVMIINVPVKADYFAPKAALREPRQFYGEPIDFRGLRNAPINEQGVVYLFGMISRELGFYIESIQQGFPDCEGKYLYDKNKCLWAKAKIEFEYKSSNFIEHAHDVNGCDFIICWINDWVDCPIRVIELRSEILKIPSK